MTTETDAEMLQRLGDDAAKWAAEFRKTAIRLGYSDMDEGWLIGWFANAIENAEITRRARAEADYDLKCTNGHDRCYMGTSDDCPYCERVPVQKFGSD